MKMHVITYGLGGQFDASKFKPIKNQMHVKPLGGLWASPVDSECGWKQWCEAESYGNLSVSFSYYVDGKFLVIDSVADLNKFQWKTFYDVIKYPDYEAVVRAGYDAIYLTERGQNATRFSQPSLYGWDCECVLILNPHCVQVPQPTPAA